MSDVFTKRKRSEVMSRIRSRGNRDTELALAKLLRQHGITGWRRQALLRFEVLSSRFPVGGTATNSRRARRSRPTTVTPDFIFPKQRVAVFVDGCFWHGCPKHSNPARWIKKSEMGGNRVQGSGFPPRRICRRYDRVQRKTETPKTGTSTTVRTGKKFWWNKLAANKARDRFVNQTLRRHGWRVVRIWEHQLCGETRVIQRVARALGTWWEKD